MLRKPVIVQQHAQNAMCFDDALDVCKGPGVETKFNWRSYYVVRIMYICAGKFAELGAV